MYHTIPVLIRREAIFKAYLNIFKTRMFQEKRWKLLSETMEVDSEGLSMELPYLQGNWKSRFQLQELTWHCNCPEMMTFYPKFLCTQLMKMGLLLKKILRTITYAWIIIYKRDQGSLPLKIKIKVFDDMKLLALGENKVDPPASLTWPQYINLSWCKILFIIIITINIVCFYVNICPNGEFIFTHGYVTIAREFVCLFGVFHPTREFFTHMETSPLPVKGCKFWHMLGTYGHWAVRVF